ncbi:MAG: DUF4834 family protein [Candidatus Azobacteroides sp.]|nr:DUF4834 family protein [Candidatus Azobacteroides sp.]
MKILGFLIIMGLLAVAFVLLFGFSVLRMLLNALFGTRPNPRNTASSNQQKAKQTTKQTNASPSVKKIFTREDGEYVDFEEIKD